MAAKVLRALPAVLVGGAARPVSAKDQLVRHSVGVRTSQLALRTADDAAHFKWMLRNVNLLYLGCAVLIVMDISYLSRFWTVCSARPLVSASKPSLLKIGV